MPSSRPKHRPKLLVADADPARREAFAALLGRRGAEVVAAGDAETARRAAGRRPAPDLALVDLASFGDGAMALCRELAAAVPTIVQLEAEAFTEETVDAALAAGAADCAMRLPPEALAPLLAAKLTRLGGRASAPAGGSFAPLVASLTKTERRLLDILLRNAGLVCRRDYLHRELYGETSFEGSRALDALVVKLRRGLGPLGAGIETVRGEGYRWNDAPAGRPRLRAVRLLVAVLGAALLAALVFALLPRGGGGALRDAAEKAGEVVRRIPLPHPPSEGAAAALPGVAPVSVSDGEISDPTGTLTIRWSSGRGDAGGAAEPEETAEERLTPAEPER